MFLFVVTQISSSQKCSASKVDTSWYEYPSLSKQAIIAMNVWKDPGMKRIAPKINFSYGSCPGRLELVKPPTSMKSSIPKNMKMEPIIKNRILMNIVL